MQNTNKQSLKAVGKMATPYAHSVVNIIVSEERLETSDAKQGKYCEFNVRIRRKSLNIKDLLSHEHSVRKVYLHLHQLTK
jgi:hypothetical protein